jgi:hypothetical protein
LDISHLRHTWNATAGNNISAGRPERKWLLRRCFGAPSGRLQMNRRRGVVRLCVRPAPDSLTPGCSGTCLLRRIAGSGPSLAGVSAALRPKSGWRR